MACDNLKQEEQCLCGNNFGLFNIPPEQFTALAALFGFLLAKDLNADEQNSLGNFLLTVGQVMVTIAAQKAIFETPEDNLPINERIDYLKNRISYIESELEKKSRV